MDGGGPVGLDIGCRVYNNANISIPNATSTALTFNTERYDNGGLHSTVSNTGRITIVEGGRYLLGVTVSFASNGVGIRQLALRLNGAGPSIAIQQFVASAATKHGLVVVTEHDLIAGDYAEVFVHQASGGALNVEAIANYTPEFWARKDDRAA